jgi:hypothetical protein
MPFSASITRIISRRPPPSSARLDNRSTRVITLSITISLPFYSCPPTMNTITSLKTADFWGIIKTTDYRVGRVLFFSSRRNWDSPNPSPAGECAPHMWYREEGHIRWRGERGWESTNSKNCGTLDIYVL